MTDDVLEIHGCYASHSNGDKVMLTISEFGSKVWIEGDYRQRSLTPSQARHLAKQLARLADRIDERTNPAVARSISEAKARGGHAAAASLTKTERTERARKAATARWGKTDKGMMETEVERIMLNDLHGLFEREFGISSNQVSNIAKGRYWTHA